MFSWLVLGLSPFAAAAEPELYAPPPPPGSAFVRFVNTGSAPAQASLAGRAVGAVEPAGATAYVVVPAGKRAAALGATSADLDVTAGTYYTIALHRGGLLTLPDVPNAHLAKAQVTLYNLTDLPAVSLRTADGAAALVDAIGPDGLGVRAVNAIKVDLAVFSGDTVLKSLPGVQLAQGESYSLFVLPGPTVTWVTARIDTTR